MLPHGKGSIDEVSFELVSAISHAVRVVGWQENLRSKEMPPRWMWAHAKELEEWFEEVDTLRRQEYGIEDDGGESVEMTRNTLSSRFKD